MPIDVLIRPTGTALVKPDGVTLFSFQGDAPPVVPEQWITQGPMGSERNDFDGWVGLSFTTGASPVTITHLARWVKAGSSQNHKLRLYTAGMVQLEEVTVNGASVSDDWGSVALGANRVLSASTVYVLGSEEFNGGDIWHNSASGYTTTAAASVTDGRYGTASPDTGLGGATPFGPLSFIHLPYP